jgi:REP element-mobilizing transposase RayT
MSKLEPVLEKGKFYHIYNRGINSCNLFTGVQTYEHFLSLYQKYIPPVADTYAWVLMPNHFHFLVRIRENVVYKYSSPSPSSNADRCFASAGDPSNTRQLTSSSNADRYFSSSHAVRFEERMFEESKWETIDLSDRKLDLSACEAPDSVGLGLQNNILRNGEAPDSVGLGLQNNILQNSEAPDSTGLGTTNKIVQHCEAPNSIASGKVPNPTHHFSHLFNAYSKYFNNFTGRHGSLFERPFDRKEINGNHYFKRMVVYIHNNPVHHKFVEHAIDYPWSSYLTLISMESPYIQHNTVIGWFDGLANFQTSHEDRIEDMDFERWLGLE